MKINRLGVDATALIHFLYILYIFYIFCTIFIQFLYILYTLYIFYILFIYLYILYIFYIFIYMHALYLPYDYISLHPYILYTYIYSTHPIPLYILYISYIIHTPLCITSAEGDLSLRDKHLSVVFSLRSKPNKQFNVSFHNYSLGKKFYIHIYIILVEFFTNPLLNTLS